MNQEIIKLFKEHKGTFVKGQSDGIYNANGFIMTDGIKENDEKDDNTGGIPLCRITNSTWVIIILHDKVTLFTNRNRLIQEVMDYEN